MTPNIMKDYQQDPNLPPSFRENTDIADTDEEMQKILDECEDIQENSDSLEEKLEEINKVETVSVKCSECGQETLVSANGVAMTNEVKCLYHDKDCKKGEIIN